MTWRNLLVLILVSLLLWLLIVWLIGLTVRGFDPHPQAQVETVVDVSLPKLVAPTTTTTVAPTTTTTARARTAPIVREASASRPAPAVVGDIPNLIRQVFGRFGADVGEQAVRVFGCETGGTYNPAASNGSHAGLAQISSRYHMDRIRRLGFTWEQMFQAMPNLTVAADIFAESGWRPWTCRRVLA